MLTDTKDTLIIPYGTANCPAALQDAITMGVPVMRIDLRRPVPLRLNNAPYAFPEPPDLVRLTATADRLDFLRDHLLSICGLWDRLPRLFLDAYFRWVAAATAANRPALSAAAAQVGGLFDPCDWGFSALQPLPQAHLAAPEAASGADAKTRVRVDVAFWTGRALVAIEVVGSATRNPARQAELERLRGGGVAVLEIAAAALQRNGEHHLAAVLPADFQSFWAGERLPSSPFGPMLPDIIPVEPEDRGLA